MLRMNKYKIDFLQFPEGGDEALDILLDDAFFASLDGSEILGGELKTNIRIREIAGVYELWFSIVGIVKVACDRCLDEMVLPIDTKNELKVKLGDSFEDTGEFVVLPEDDGTLDLSWYIYEFVALNIPIKHVHEEGQCNKDMVACLNEHLATLTDEDVESCQWSDEDKC